MIPDPQIILSKQYTRKLQTLL